MSTTSNQYMDSNQTPQNSKPAAEQRTYVQQAVGGATNLANSAVEAVSAYLPGKLIDPTTNYANRQLHVGGVGDLGTRSEVDVVRLPEERMNPDPMGLMLPRTEAAFPAPGSGASGEIYEQGREATGGVGNLGTTSEADVVRLPEERMNPSPLGTSRSPLGQRQGGDTLLDAPAVGLGGHSGPHHDITKDGHSGGVTGANHDMDHGLGHTWKRQSTQAETAGTMDTLATPNAKMDASTGIPHQEGMFQSYPMTDNTTRRDETVETDTGSPTGKVKTMDKIKGSIQIAKGKVTRDEEAMEAGRALKTGQHQQ